MANKEGISAVLKRNLKEGREYNKLIPRVKCERTTLGKGDTFFTVDSMKAWIEKFSFQTEKLAPNLKGRTLGETVNNIYNFLYHHIQYEADGSLQQLRSPACSWMQRYDGVDCKSYSVFASSILSNLGIKHFIRQVRQPYFYPDQFTHVYIVVPKNQNTKDLQNSAMFVLDATKHQNVEGKFLEKVDLPMTKLSHIGLNAPQINISRDERAQKITRNFEAFSIFLLQQGADLATVNAMRADINKSTSIGKDPKFKIGTNGIIIDGKLFPLRLTPVNYSEGLGIEPMTTMATASAIMGMLPEGFIDDTFGAVFANGFDLSCWNSASSPQNSQKNISTYVMPFFEYCVAKISNPRNNAELLHYFNLALEGSYKLAALYRDMSKNTSWAKCTIDGHKVMAEFAQGMRGQFNALLESPNFSVTKTMVNGKAPFVFPGTMTSNGQPFEIGVEGAASFPVTFPRITSISSNGSIDNMNIKGSTGNNTGGNNYIPTNNTGTGEQSKSNTGLIIGGVALASLPLLFMLKKGSVEANSPATRKPSTKNTRK